MRDTAIEKQRFAIGSEQDGALDMLRAKDRYSNTFCFVDVGHGVPTCIARRVLKLDIVSEQYVPRRLDENAQCKPRAVAATDNHRIVVITARDVEEKNSGVYTGVDVTGYQRVAARTVAPCTATNTLTDRSLKQHFVGRTHGIRGGNMQRAAITRIKHIVRPEPEDNRVGGVGHQCDING